MTVQELSDALAALDPKMPVVLWNDADGSHGEAKYLTAVDGEVTIAGELEG